MKITRRDALTLLGLAGAGYAASTLLRPAPVRAGQSPIPKRIIFFYTEHGTQKQFRDDGSLEPLWAPTVGGAPDATSINAPWSTSTFTLADLHKPLVPHQKQLLLLDGIDMISANADPTAPTNAHLAGETHALVAQNRLSGAIAGGPSIDQYIAQAINSPAPLTALPSLEVVVSAHQADAGGGSVESSPLYAAAGQPIPIYGDVHKVYDRMFPNGPKGTTAEEIAAQQKALAQKKSVLEATYARYKAISSSPRASALDRERLDAHAAALRDLEMRLSVAPSAGCVEPDTSILAPAVSSPTPGEESAAYDANADVMMRLVQTALACDLTRVVTMYVPVPPDDRMGYVSIGGTTDFHDMVHKTNGVAPPLGKDQGAMAIMTAYHTYLASLFARLLDLLVAVPQADGTTLLDNTLVVWCGQISGGDHSLDRIPYVLAGSMGGLVKPGRYIRYPRVKDMNAWPAYSLGPAHNDLMVSLANFMGVETNTFGNAAVCKGPLAGLAG